MLIGIHYLRAIAALMVVIFHAISFFVIYRNLSTTLPFYVMSEGVDIFFVISGFLMVETTLKCKESRLDFSDFMSKRLLRIGPIYWLITLAIGVMVLARPALSEKVVDGTLVLKSLLFLPSKLNTSHLQTTIIPQEWTLIYEMFFYSLFAICTSVHYKKGIAATLVILALLVCMHPLAKNFYVQTYTAPIILEFGFGIVIALLPRIAAKPAQAALCTAGALWIVVGGIVAGVDLTYRPLTCGIGAALLIYGANGYRPTKRIPLLLILGDASYSLYLIHMYVIKAAAKFLSPTPFSIVAVILIACVTGYFVHTLIENPLQKKAKESMAAIKGMFLRFSMES